MNEDEFFDWLAQFCIAFGYGGLTAQTILHEATKKGIDLGSIFYLGRSHLTPRGWNRVFSTSGQSVYLPPKNTVVTLQFHETNPEDTQRLHHRVRTEMKERGEL